MQSTDVMQLSIKSRRHVVGILQSDTLIYCIQHFAFCVTILYSTCKFIGTICQRWRRNNGCV